MAGKRRHKKSQGELEDDLLSNPRWSGLREQQRLQQQNHSAVENQRARDECRRLREEGYGALSDYCDWQSLWGSK